MTVWAEDLSIGKILIGKKCGVNFWKKARKFCMQNLTKERKQPPVVILQQTTFYNICFLCLMLGIIRRSDVGVQFMSFPSQMFFRDINHGNRAAIFKENPLWLFPFNMTVAASCYYEKVRRTMRTAIVSYLLKYNIWNLYVAANMYSYFHPVFSKYQYGFRQGRSSQNCLCLWL